jgi:hypothetical protein
MGTRLGPIALLLTIALGTGPIAHAGPLLANGGFETFTGALGSDGGAVISTTNLPGWTPIGAPGILKNPNIYNLTPSRGINFLDLTGYNPTGGGGGNGVEQKVSGLTVGNTYDLTMDLGVSGGPCISGLVNCAGPFKVQLSAGGVAETFTQVSTLAANQWATFGFDFVPTASTTEVVITLQSVTGYYAGLDNVVLTDVTATTSVPEPGTLAVFSLGVTSLALALRRKASGAQ